MESVAPFYGINAIDSCSPDGKADVSGASSL